MATTFMTVMNKPEILKAAEWIIRESEARIGRPFVLWNAAQQEIEYCNHMQYPVGADIDFWEQQKSLVPTPPKVGVKVTGRHRSLQVEDIFHWSIIGGDEWKMSDDSNYIKYMVAHALIELMRAVCDDQVVVEIVDWSSVGIYQQLLDEAKRRQRQTQERHRPRRRRRS